MKNFSRLLAVLFLLHAPFNLQAALISTGEQLVFSFTSSDFTSLPTDTINSNGAQVGYNFGGGTFISNPDGSFSFLDGQLTPGETIQVDFYQNANQTSLFDTHTLDGSDPSPAGATHLLFTPFNTGSSDNTAWQDLEGSFSITVLSGEVDISTSYISIYRDGLSYNTTSTPAPVPLPASIWLLLTGLTGLFISRRK